MLMHVIGLHREEGFLPLIVVDFAGDMGMDIRSSLVF